MMETPLAPQDRKTKEVLEFARLLLEFPKTAIIIVSFFATASALSLRLSAASNGIAPHWIFPALYLFGLLFTCYFFVKTYAYMSNIAHSVGTLFQRDLEFAVITDEQVKKSREMLASSFNGDRYFKFGSMTATVVLGWTILTSLIVIFA